MIAFVLVIWFGFGQYQSSFSVSDIANQAECERLGNQMSPHYKGGEARCYPYRKAVK